jgi:hypothetical protein
MWLVTGGKSIDERSWSLMIVGSTLVLGWRTPSAGAEPQPSKEAEAANPGEK